MKALPKIYPSMFWGYLILLLLVASAIYLAGDVVWWGTLLMFGPKWIWGVPIPLLFLLACCMSCGRRWCLLASVGLFGYFVMGFNLPLAVFLRSELPTTRFMTLNMEGDHTDRQKLQQLLDQFQPDVVLLQECPTDVGTYFPPDWNTNQDGELAIASRYPLDALSSVNRILNHRYPRAVGIVNRVHLPSGTFPIASVHLLSPSDGLNRILSRKTILDLKYRTLIDQEIGWRRAEAEHVSNSLRNISDSLVIAGDFNMPVESTIYRNTWGGYFNAFSRAGFGCGATAFQERGGLWNSARIDHVLHAEGWQSRSCWVGADVGSDHLPLFADLVSVR